MSGVFGGLNYQPLTSITSNAGAVAWNLDANPNAFLQLTENTVITLSGGVAGQVYSIEIKQHASSAKTCTFANVNRASGDSAYAVSTGLSKRDTIGVRKNNDGTYDEANFKTWG